MRGSSPLAKTSTAGCSTPTSAWPNSKSKPAAADAAADVLERVIGLDLYAEEPYRRLMTIQARHGRPDAVTATWLTLQRRLADLDVEVDEATARLYRSLTNSDASVAAPRPIRLSS